MPSLSSYLKPLLHLADLDFSLGGISVLRELPGREYVVLAGPYFANELRIFRGALRQLEGCRGVAVREESGGICIYRRVPAETISAS